MDNEEEETDGDEYGLVMPFVVTVSNGGPLDDNAFVLGAQFGQHLAELRACPGAFEWRAVIDPIMLPQYDLLAMNNQMVMTSHAWDEHPDNWVFITFKRLLTDVIEED